MNKRFIYYCLSLVLVLSLIVYFYFYSEQTPPTAQSKVRIGNVELTVDIADTPQLTAQGLSGREELPEEHGMFFIFPSSGIRSFWMKDMRFPIDIVWMDSSFRVVHITRNARPESFPETYAPDVPIQYVLEISAGAAEQHGIDVGDVAALTMSR